jgi:hypothetical protein
MFTDYHGRSVRMALYPMVDCNFILKLTGQSASQIVEGPKLVLNGPLEMVLYKNMMQEDASHYKTDL